MHCSHGARPLVILVHQLRNSLLILLVSTAVASAFVGEGTDAVIILGIIGLSVGLGFFNEYRSARAVEALHSRLRHTAPAVRDGKAVAVDVTLLVPGDVVQLSVGDVVSVDLRLLRADGLECDESVLTGESLPVEEQVGAVGSPESALALPSCAFMGTVVRNGSGLGIVAQTGAGTEFGRIATRLGERQPQTATRRLAQRRVVVKRLVAIEDLGNIDVFFTDKTGTLTEGQITFSSALDAAGQKSEELLREGLLCNEAVLTDGHVAGGNPLDRALWESPDSGRPATLGAKRLARLPFDYERRLASVLMQEDGGERRLIVTEHRRQYWPGARTRRRKPKRCSRGCLPRAAAWSPWRPAPSTDRPN